MIPCDGEPRGLASKEWRVFLRGKVNSMRSRGLRQNLRMKPCGLRRTQREVGMGVSTLVRGIGRSRDRLIDRPAVASGEEDSTAELKRLRHENEILRQEREILKRATTFFAKEGSR